MLGIKKIDMYIAKRFILTFFVALLLIIGIVIIFDISEKIDYFVRYEAPLKEEVVRKVSQFRTVLRQYVLASVRVHYGDFLHLQDGIEL